MNLLSLILGIIAAICFAIAAFANPEPGSGRVRWGWAGGLFLTLMLMAQFLIVTADPITTGS
jgi:hypothetical protein